MADPKVQNYDDEYEDDEFEECNDDDVLTMVNGERADGVEDIDDDETASDTSLSPTAQWKNFKPVYNAPLVSSNAKYNSNYDTSSEDEELVIGQTIAEINTIAMDLNAASDFDTKSLQRLAQESLILSQKLFVEDKAGGDVEVPSSDEKPKSRSQSITDFIRERKRLLREQEKQERDEKKSFTGSESENENENEENFKTNVQTNRELEEDRSLMANENEDFISRNDNYLKKHYAKQEQLKEDLQTQMRLAAEKNNRRLQSMEKSEGEVSCDEEEDVDSKSCSTLAFNHQDVAASDTEGYEDHYEDDFEDYDPDDQSPNDDPDMTEDDQPVNQDNDDETEDDEMGAGNDCEEINIVPTRISHLQIHQKETTDDKMINDNDTSKITAILSAALQNENASGVEGLEGMIKALHLIKETLSSTEESDESVSPSVSKQSNNQKLSRATSASTVSHATVIQTSYNGTSRTLSATESHSKIPRFIAAIKKSCTSLKQARSDPAHYKGTIKDNFDCAKQVNDKRDAASDYDSCSSASSKSSCRNSTQAAPSTYTEIAESSLRSAQKSRMKIDAISDYDSCSTSSSKLNCRIQSRTPTSFNSDEHIMHMSLIKAPSRAQLPKESKTGPQRKNFSFSNERLREIERHNMILLKKIETQKPSYPGLKKNKDKPSPAAAARVSSAAINRKKQQRQIDLDNQMLKRKLESIQLRRIKKA